MRESKTNYKAWTFWFFYSESFLTLLKSILRHFTHENQFEACNFERFCNELRHSFIRIIFIFLYMHMPKQGKGFDGKGKGKRVWWKRVWYLNRNRVWYIEAEDHLLNIQNFCLIPRTNIDIPLFVWLRNAVKSTLNLLLECWLISISLTLVLRNSGESYLGLENVTSCINIIRFLYIIGDVDCKNVKKRA